MCIWASRQEALCRSQRSLFRFLVLPKDICYTYLHAFVICLYTCGNLLKAVADDEGYKTPVFAIATGDLCRKHTLLLSKREREAFLNPRVIQSFREKPCLLAKPKQQSHTERYNGKP